jgi:hypothetical protein
MPAAGSFKTSCPGKCRVGLHPIAEDRHTAYLFLQIDGAHIFINNKKDDMNLLLTPFFAGANYIGGGFGLVLIIVVVVLLTR